MPAKSKKWETFKANSSNLNVTTPNIGHSNLQADWYRAAYGEYPININGVSLKEIAEKFNRFQTKNDVLNFFEEVILKDFIGNLEDKENAVEYLEKAFHQGGLLHPVSSALATELRGNDGNVACTLRNDRRDSLVNIKTTNTGFKVQEYSEAKALLPIAENLMEYVSDGMILPEKGKDSVIKAEATIAIDFSKNSSNPSLIVESNHMEILHEGLKSHLDSRSLGQKIVDFFKNFLGLSKVKDISPVISEDVMQQEEQAGERNSISPF